MDCGSDSWFLIIAMIVVLLVGGLAVANIYYWNKIRNKDEVTENTGLTLLVLNSVAVAGLAILFLWAIYLLIQGSNKMMHYPGMGQVMTMGSPVYSMNSPHYM